MESTTSLAIAEAPQEGPAWLLSPAQEWFKCTAYYINDGPLWISNTPQPIAGGMSGSPVISEAGAAIGVVAVGQTTSSDTAVCKDESGTPNPRLLRDLPGWVLKGLSR